MQYTVITLNENGAENPYTSIDDYIERNNCEHMIDYRQTNIKILGIAESYNTLATRILTDKGYLFVEISENIYHEYHLFAEPSNLNFGHVIIMNEPLDIHDASYENTHRLVLNRQTYVDYSDGNRTKYRYYADGIKYGNDGQTNIYRLDIDGYVLNRQIYQPDADGFYHVGHEATNIRYFLIPYKQYVYIHLDPAENVIIKLINIDGAEISSKVYKFDEDNYYIDVESDALNGEGITDPDEGLDISAKTAYDENNYMYITFIGANENAPEQVLLEVC